MTTSKKESLQKLSNMIRTAEEKRESKEIKIISELKELTEKYLYADDRPERLKLKSDYEVGKPLTGKDGIRRKLAAFDLAYFGRAYLPHYFSRPSPQFHKNLDDLWTDGVMKGLVPDNGQVSKKINRMKGCKKATAAPRGHAKSTNLTFKDDLHAVLYEYKHYIIILSDSSEQSEGFLESIRTELEENEAIQEDFGDIVGDVWRNNVIVTKTGIKIEAIGSGKKIRGRKHKNWRPDLIVLDDIENDENVNTPEQRRKLENWFYKAVSKAGDDYTDFIYIGTMLHYDSLLAKVMRNPTYQSVKYKAVMKFSSSKMWDEWESIFTDLDNENHEEDALNFFEDHKAEMLDGTEVLWEEKLSYYDLMVTKVSEGEASFNSELQNEPINPDDCLFNEEWFDWYNPFEVNFADERFQFFGFVDPSLGKTKKADYSAIITMALDKSTGYKYVVDADIERRHPDIIITDTLEKAYWIYKTYKKRYVKFGVETVQFQWFLKEALVKESAKRRLYLPIEEVTQTSDKILRITTLQPEIKNKYIKFNRQHKRLMEQLRNFPMADHDDGPDALEGCNRLCSTRKRTARTGNRTGLGI